MASCLDCNKFNECADPRKGVDYVCNRWEQGDVGPLSLESVVDGYLGNKEGEVKTENLPKGVDDSVGHLYDPNKEYGEGDEKSLISAVESIIDNGSGVPADLKVDDRDLAEYPNFFEFSIDPQGLGNPPLNRQLAIATHVFGEWCPPCSHPKFRRIDTTPLSSNIRDFPDKVSFLRWGKCPNCGKTKSQLIKDGELYLYTELDMCAGQRSGKSTLISLMTAYIIHKYLKMQRPMDLLGLTTSSMLTGSVTALQLNRAIRLLWQPIHNMITHVSPWFQEYIKLLTHYEDVYGEKLFKITDTIIQFTHRSLIFYPTSSNRRTLRGDTRILSAIDELGWFPHGEGTEGREYANADDTYDSLDRSMLTVRDATRKRILAGNSNMISAYALNISSPSNARDKIMTLVKDNWESDNVLAVWLPTWELNPEIGKDNPDIVKAYRNDPVSADRDYGANPPLSSSPFITDSEWIRELIGSYQNRVTYDYVHRNSKSGDKRFRAAKVVNTNQRAMVPRSVMSLDAGYSNNSFALSIGNASLDERGDPRAAIDVMVEVAPKRGDSVINYTDILDNLMIPLAREFNVGYVIADRWQSIKLLQDMEKAFPDLTAVQYSPKYKEFHYVLDHIQMEDPPITIPRPEWEFDEVKETDVGSGEYPEIFAFKPISHFIFQCLTVSDSGKSVDKGMNLTDDLFRASFTNLIHLLDADFVKKNLRNKGRSRKAKTVGVKNREGQEGNLNSGVGALGSGTAQGAREERKRRRKRGSGGSGVGSKGNF